MLSLPDVGEVRRRSRKALRKIGLRPGPLYGRLADAGRSFPIPAKARVALSTVLLRKPWPVSVPVDKLLLGAQNGWTAREFASRTDDLLWPSTRLLDGPHVALLRLADLRDALSDEDLLASRYVQLGLRCIATGGHYFGATDTAGVLARARSLIAWHRGERRPAFARQPSQSGRMDPILVAPVRGCDYYQVLDGHHRLAVAAASGARTVPVTAKWLPVTTPLQDLLTEMSWLDGIRALYQPIEAPEVRNWTTVRQCTDRLAKMRAFLAERDLLPAVTTSYLDVASCYGWFVRQMQDLGYRAAGLERDPLAVPLGRALYGLDPDVIKIGDASELTTRWSHTWDVTSCFSLLHHFVLGRGSISAEQLVGLLDQTTDRVLFLDTGQEHEAWFRQSLAGWSPRRIEAFLREHTSFDEIVDLGPDHDARPPYADNYGRHLFACVRTQPRRA